MIRSDINTCYIAQLYNHGVVKHVFPHGNRMDGVADDGKS